MNTCFCKENLNFWEFPPQKEGAPVNLKLGLKKQNKKQFFSVDGILVFNSCFNNESV